MCFKVYSYECDSLLVPHWVLFCSTELWARPAPVKTRDRKQRLLQVGAEDRTGAAVTPEHSDSSCGDPEARSPSSEKGTDKYHEGRDLRTHEHTDDVFWRLSGKLAEGGLEGPKLPSSSASPTLLSPHFPRHTLLLLASASCLPPSMTLEMPSGSIFLNPSIQDPGHSPFLPLVSPSQASHHPKWQ